MAIAAGEKIPSVTLKRTDMSDVSTDENTSWSVALGLVDGDSDMDAVFTTLNGTNRTCLGDGAGGFTCSDISTGFSLSTGVQLAFLDGDGNLDAVFSNTGGFGGFSGGGGGFGGGGASGGW